MNAKTAGWGLTGVGLVLAVLAVIADPLELGGDPTAFGWKQITALSVGVVLIVAGQVWRVKGSAGK